jgi:hypothetical protein
MRGYYRPSRHGPRPKPAAEPDAIDPWALLRLPNPPSQRPLDPIEELRQREGIEIKPEDRKPSR